MHLRKCMRVKVNLEGQEDHLDPLVPELPPQNWKTVQNLTLSSLLRQRARVSFLVENQAFLRVKNLVLDKFWFFGVAFIHLYSLMAEFKALNFSSNLWDNPS